MNDISLVERPVLELTSHPSNPSSKTTAGVPNAPALTDPPQEGRGSGWNRHPADTPRNKRAGRLGGLGGGKCKSLGRPPSPPLPPVFPLQLLPGRREAPPAFWEGTSASKVLPPSNLSPRRLCPPPRSQGPRVSLFSRQPGAAKGPRLFSQSPPLPSCSSMALPVRLRLTAAAVATRPPPSR